MRWMISITKLKTKKSSEGVWETPACLSPLPLLKAKYIYTKPNQSLRTTSHEKNDITLHASGLQMSIFNPDTKNWLSPCTVSTWWSYLFCRWSPKSIALSIQKRAGSSALNRCACLPKVEVALQRSHLTADPTLIEFLNGLGHGLSELSSICVAGIELLELG